MIKSILFTLLTLVYPQPKSRKPPLRGGEYFPESRGWVDYQSRNETASSWTYRIIGFVLLVILVMMLGEIAELYLGPQIPFEPTSDPVETLKDWTERGYFMHWQREELAGLFGWDLPPWIGKGN